MNPIEINAIDHVVLRVKDLDAALAFYRDALGLSIERQLDIGLVQLRAGASLIDLVPVSSPLGQSRRTGSARATAATWITLRWNSAASTPPRFRAHLDAHGIEHGEPSQRYGAKGTGPSIYIKDPDGNTVELKGPGDGSAPLARMKVMEITPGEFRCSRRIDDSRYGAGGSVARRPHRDALAAAPTAHRAGPPRNRLSARSSRRHRPEQDESARREDVRVRRHERRRQDHASRISRRQTAARPARADRRGHGPGMGMVGTGYGHEGMGMGMGGHGSGPDGGPTRRESAQRSRPISSRRSTPTTTASCRRPSSRRRGKPLHTMMKTQMFTTSRQERRRRADQGRVSAVRAKMSAMDTNGDGTVTREEMKAAHAAPTTQTPPAPPN